MQERGEDIENLQRMRGERLAHNVCSHILTFQPVTQVSFITSFTDLIFDFRIFCFFSDKFDDFPNYRIFKNVIDAGRTFA